MREAADCLGVTYGMLYQKYKDAYGNIGGKSMKPQNQYRLSQIVGNSLRCTVCGLSVKDAPSSGPVACQKCISFFRFGFRGW